MMVLYCMVQPISSNSKGSRERFRPGYLPPRRLRSSMTVTGLSLLAVLVVRMNGGQIIT